MHEHILIGLGSIVVLGILAQWLAWRLHLPAILLLLVFGFLAGPVTGILNPDAVFGELLFPLVSISVAIILFEGGLSLKLHELRQGGPTVARLATLGIGITWLLAAIGAHHIVGLNWSLAILLGAILVVTGPTVIIPILRQIRPTGRLGSVVKWEGIINDPIGAILAVLVFEAVVATGPDISSVLVAGVLKALVLGTLLGVLGAAAVVGMLRYYLVPDFLHNPVSTMLVVIVFLAANAIQSESGLLAVTVMGIAVANQRFATIRHINEFKENLRVILIASLFIILAARLPVADLALGNWQEWLFIILLILVVRPAAVLTATAGSQIPYSEKLFLAWIAPRGIVAAAVVSIFALRLEGTGFPGVDRLVPLTFKIIFATVAVYGLTVPWVARRLKVAKPNPQGILFGGAQNWVQRVAEVLKEEGFEASLIDSNWGNISRARRIGLSAYYGSLLSEEVFTRVPLDEIGRFIAVTPNDEVNSLAALHFAEIFSRSNVFQLPRDEQRKEGPRDKEGRQPDLPSHLHGRLVFSPKATDRYLRELMNRGAVVKRTTITEEFDMDRFREHYGDEAVPLFIITEEGALKVYTVQDPPEPRPGERLVSLVLPRERDEKVKAEAEKRSPETSHPRESLHSQEEHVHASEKEKK